MATGMINEQLKAIYVSTGYINMSAVSGSNYNIGTLSNLTNGRITDMSNVLGIAKIKIEGNERVDHGGTLSVASNNVYYYAMANNSTRVSFSFSILTYN